MTTTPKARYYIELPEYMDGILMSRMFDLINKSELSAARTIHILEEMIDVIKDSTLSGCSGHYMPEIKTGYIDLDE